MGSLTQREVHFLQPGSLGERAWLRFLSTRTASGLVLHGEVTRVEAWKGMFPKGEGSRPPVHGNDADPWSVASGPPVVGQCASEAVGASDCN
jgi:hypothetical protein